MDFGCCLVRMPDVSLCHQNKLWMTREQILNDPYAWKINWVLFLLGNWEVSVCFLFTWDLNSCILKYIVSWTTGRSWFWTWLDQISRHCSYIQWIAPSPFHCIFRNCFSGATTFKAIVCLFTFWPCFLHWCPEFCRTRFCYLAVQLVTCFVYSTKRRKW